MIDLAADTILSSILLTAMIVGTPILALWLDQKRRKTDMAERWEETRRKVRQERLNIQF